jgi:hypothetical protein
LIKFEESARKFKVLEPIKMLQEETFKFHANGMKIQIIDELQNDVFIKNFKIKILINMPKMLD